MRAFKTLRTFLDYFPRNYLLMDTPTINIIQWVKNVSFFFFNCAGRFFTVWATRESPHQRKSHITLELSSWPFLSVQFRSVKYVPTVVKHISLNLFIFPNWNPIELPSPLPMPLAPTMVLSVSMNLATLGTVYKWNHTVFVLCDWLTSLLHNALKVHPRCSFSFYSSILHWMMKHICLSTHPLMNTGSASTPCLLCLVLP